MPNEYLIQNIETIIAEIIRLGGQSERTSIVPNMLVRDATPAGLTDYVIIADDRDFDNILALKVPGVVYADNDLVNVIFPQGGEAIAFQQGSSSTTSGLWDVVAGTNDIYYNKGDVGIGKSVAPDAALEILSTTQAQLRLTYQEDTKFADFTVDTNHDLTIDPSSTGQIILASDDVTIGEDLIHSGDTDTKMSFTADDVEFTVGALSLLKLTEAAQDVVRLGPGSGDVDINFNGDMFLEGSSGNFGVGTATPGASNRVHVYKNINSVARLNVENPNTGASAWSDIYMTADNGAGGVHGYAVQMWGAGVTATWSGITLANYARFRSDSTVIGLIFTTGGSYPLIFGTADTERMRIDNAGLVGIGTNSPSTRLDIDAGAMEFAEMTAPAAGAANTARLFSQDNGAGKTQLAVRFNTGAIQILATEP